MMNRLVSSSNSLPPEISSWSNAATAFQLLKKRLDLIRQEDLRLSTGTRVALAVQCLLQLGPLVLLDLGRANDHMRRRLHTRNIDRFGVEAPRQSRRFGRLIDGLTILGRRGRSGTIDQVNLDTVIGAICIVTDQSTITEPELLARLLGGQNTLGDLAHAVALIELLGGVERLDRALEGLGRDDVRVHPVVGILLVGLCSLGAFRHLGQARPGDSVLILTAFTHDVQYATVNANTVESLGVLIPLQCTLGHQASFLSVQIYNIVIDVVTDIMPGKIRARQTCYFLRQVAVGVLVHDYDLISGIDQIRYIVSPYRADVLFVIHDTWVGHLDIGRRLEIYLIRPEYTFQLSVKIKPAVHCTPSQSSTQALGRPALHRRLSISPPPKSRTGWRQSHLSRFSVA
nr:MAG TPA: hypothetical protein [Caudoviricetes sp.]